MFKKILFAMFLMMLSNTENARASVYGKCYFADDPLGIDKGTYVVSPINPICDFICNSQCESLISSVNNGFELNADLYDSCISACRKGHKNVYVKRKQAAPSAFGSSPDILSSFSNPKEESSQKLTLTAVCDQSDNSYTNPKHAITLTNQKLYKNDKISFGMQFGSPNQVFLCGKRSAVLIPSQIFNNPNSTGLSAKNIWNARNPYYYDSGIDVKKGDVVTLQTYGIYSNDASENSVSRGGTGPYMSSLLLNFNRNPASLDVTNTAVSSSLITLPNHILRKKTMCVDTEGDPYADSSANSTQSGSSVFNSTDPGGSNYAISGFNYCTAETKIPDDNSNGLFFGLQGSVKTFNNLFDKEIAQLNIDTCSGDYGKAKCLMPSIFASNGLAGVSCIVPFEGACSINPLLPKVGTRQAPQQITPHIMSSAPANIVLEKFLKIYTYNGTFCDDNEDPRCSNNFDTFNRIGLKHFDLGGVNNWQDNIGGISARISVSGCPYELHGSNNRLIYAFIDADCTEEDMMNKTFYKSLVVGQIPGPQTGKCKATPWMYVPREALINEDHIVVKDINFDTENGYKVILAIEDWSYDENRRSGVANIKYTEEYMKAMPDSGTYDVQKRNEYFQTYNKHGSYVVNVSKIANTTGLSRILSNEIKHIKTYLLGDGATQGMNQKVFNSLVTDSNIIKIIRLLLVLYIIMNALFLLMGSIKVTAHELITRMLKFAIVSALISEGSWDFFNNYFFKFLTEGNVEIIAWLIAGLIPVDANSIMEDSSKLFMVFDPFIEMIQSGVFWTKIIAIGLSSITGFFLLYIFLLGTVQTFIIMFQIATMFMLSILGISFLLMLAPIFISFLLFKNTEKMFKGWCNQLLAFWLHPIMLMTSMAILMTMIVFAYMSALAFTACNVCFFKIYIPKIVDVCLLPGVQSMYSMHQVNGGGSASIRMISPIICIYLLSQSMNGFVKISLDLASYLAMSGLSGFNMGTVTNHNPYAEIMNVGKMALGVDQGTKQSLTSIQQQAENAYANSSIRKGYGKILKPGVAWLGSGIYNNSSIVRSAVTKVNNLGNYNFKIGDQQYNGNIWSKVNNAVSGTQDALGGVWRSWRDASSGGDTSKEFWSDEEPKKEKEKKPRS